jgi:hypothetical protein
MASYTRESKFEIAVFVCCKGFERNNSFSYMYVLMPGLRNGMNFVFSKSSKYAEKHPDTTAH